MKISRGRLSLFYFFGCTRPRSAGRNHQKDAWWFPERLGNPLSSPRLDLLSGGDFSPGWRGRSGRGGSVLCSHVDVCCLRGWPCCERRGTHGRVHWSVCMPVVRCGWGGAPTFFPVNAVKCGGCSSEGADKSEGRLRSVARTEPSVPERRPVGMPGLL